MPPDTSSAPHASPRSACPICGKSADPHYRPFCSKRCADIDLNRWLGGVYAIPLRQEEEDDEGRAVPPEQSQQ